MLHHDYGLTAEFICKGFFLFQVIRYSPGFRQMESTQTAKCFETRCEWSEGVKCFFKICKLILTSTTNYWTFEAVKVRFG